MNKEVEEFFDWRNQMRAKHRTMTIAEYRAWCHVGDLISDHRSTNAFPGGLTIILGRDSGIFGKVDP